MPTPNGIGQNDGTGTRQSTGKETSPVQYQNTSRSSKADAVRCKRCGRAVPNAEELCPGSVCDYCWHEMKFETICEKCGVRRRQWSRGEECMDCVWAGQGVPQCTVCGNHPNTPRGERGECQSCGDRFRKLMEVSGIPSRHRQFKTWDSLKGEADYAKAIAAVRDFTLFGDGVLAIVGSPGTGKTQAACVAIAESAFLGRRSRYTTVVEMMANLKERFDQKHDGESNWLSDFSALGLLVIDEIGEAPQSEYGAAMFNRLVDLRYRELRPTIMAGNVAPDQIVSVVGARVVDRCREGGGLVNFSGWPSWRAAAR